MDLNISNLSFSGDNTIEKIVKQDDNLIIKCNWDCRGDLEVNDYPDFSAGFVLKEISLYLEDIDFADILTREAVQMYEREYDLNINEIEELIDEIDEEMDIDIEKIISYIEGLDLHDGDCLAYGKGIEFSDNGDNDELTLEFGVNSNYVNNFINDVDDGVNFAYECFVDGDYEDSFEEEWEAIDYVKDEVQRLIDDGKSGDDINWGDCFVEKQYWYLINESGDKDYEGDGIVYSADYDSDFDEARAGYVEEYAVVVNGDYDEYCDDEDEAISALDDRLQEMVDGGEYDYIIWDRYYVVYFKRNKDGDVIEDNVVYNPDPDDFEPDISYYSYVNDELLEEHSDEDDAIEEVKRAIQEMIDEGRRDDVEWDRCYVSREINGGNEDEIWWADEDDFEEETEEDTEISEEIIAPNDQLPTDLGLDKKL